ncbi:MAG: sporulation initiation factor Spo0A C-terminal domain-containing protein [Thomasclavelia sp.]
MDNEVNIVILSEDRNLTKSLIDKINSQDNYLVKRKFDSGKDCIIYLTRNKCDLLIVDLILTEIDGIGVIEKIIEANHEAFERLVCISNFTSGVVFEQLEALNVDYYFKKPVNYDYFMDIINKMVKERRSINTKEIIKIDYEQAANQLLSKLAMPRHLKGFKYIKTAIGLVCENINLLSEITKELYPQIAYLHGTTASRVEQAIRHAIKNTWENGNQEAWHDIFGYRTKYRPCNSEFISTIVDKLLLESKR